MSLQGQGDEGLPVGLATGKCGQVLDRSESSWPSSDAEPLCHEVTESLRVNVCAADECDEPAAAFGIIECDDGAVAYLRFTAQYRFYCRDGDIHSVDGDHVVDAPENAKPARVKLAEVAGEESVAREVRGG